jgi:hypothetical protein
LPGARIDGMSVDADIQSMQPAQAPSSLHNCVDSSRIPLSPIRDTRFTRKTHAASLR